jgi:MarR family 2-MHQ and catechol resistance regulon transcriptional repressor
LRVPTHYQGPPDEVAALDAFIKLARAADAVTHRLQPLLTAAGLTAGQFGALEALLHLGPLCQRELGDKLLMSGGNVTMVVGNLERRGLVRRERDATDRRVRRVHLTPAGTELISRLFPQHAAAVAAEFGVLAPAEQDELGRLCRKLGRRSR